MKIAATSNCNLERLGRQTHCPLPPHTEKTSISLIHLLKLFSFSAYLLPFVRFIFNCTNIFLENSLSYIEFVCVCMFFFWLACSFNQPFIYEAAADAIINCFQITIITFSIFFKPFRYLTYFQPFRPWTLIRPKQCHKYKVFNTGS